MKNVIAPLADDLGAWAERSEPIRTGDRVPLFRLDQSAMSRTLRDLFFDDSSPEAVSLTGGETSFLRQQTLSTGRLRNSFFPEVLRQHSRYDAIALSFDVGGAFSYEVHQTSGDNAPEVFFKGLAEEGGEEGGHVTPGFSLAHDVGRDARLTWQLRALHEDAVLRDVAWQGIAPDEAEARMVVVLRTFGRTRDVQALLTSFEEDAGQSAHYRRMLKNVFFLVLDTSNDVGPEDYAPLEGFEHVTGHVMQGANLGGGGNMSQALRYLETALEDAGVETDELLLLDDDLRVSLESLLRHWGCIAFRADDTVFTLPVMMKSEPRKMWEDGAIWGRFLDQHMSEDRTVIAPRLLRHHRVFDGDTHLGEMARAHYPEYCTFIFFSLTHDLFKRTGYPTAFFLRGDDIEYSLRLGEAGGRILSNPNLCAWHEAAHSYGQEYMSIAHGVIINMRYGAESADDFAAFFYGRMLAHAAIGDAFGLQLYAAVLSDLTSQEMFLTHAFADRYIARLSEFKTFDGAFEYFSGDLREGLKRNAGGAGFAECAFLYPGVPHGAQPARVLMENPHTGLFRLYDSQDAGTVAACSAAVAELTQALTRFIEGYDDLRAHYLEQLDAAQAAGFWDHELTLNAAPATVLAGLGRGTVEVSEDSKDSED